VAKKEPDTAATAKTYDEAVAYCLSKGNPYRLPEVKELASLLDYSHLNPALPSGHPFTGVQSGGLPYWSVTTNVFNPPDAWNVYFWNGLVGVNNKSVPNPVWCVRGA